MCDVYPPSPQNQTLEPPLVELVKNVYYNYMLCRIILTCLSKIISDGELDNTH